MRKGFRSPTVARSITVVAVRTLRPAPKEMPAVPLVAAVVPERVVEDVAVVPSDAVAVRFTVVPFGTLTPLMTTVTGLAWSAGRIMSGDP